MTPLPSVALMIQELAAVGIELPEGPVHVDGFGDSAELSEELLSLIRLGRKRAGTSLLWGCEADGQALPSTGSIEIVVDHHNAPALVTKITSVEIVPFNEVTPTYAAIEGEGDGSLEYWRKGHWAFFGRECRRIGREPAQDMPVVCCVFEVLHVVPRARGA